MSKRKKKLIHRIVFLFFLLIALFVVVDFQIRPVIKSLAQYKAKMIAVTAINDSVMDVLDQSGITYDSLIKVSKDSAGKVTAIETNVININMLKSKIVKSISNVITNYKSDELNIPMGTLTGIQFFSGRGPAINFKIVPSSTVNTQMYSKFESAGINQVLHKIMIKVDMDIIAIIPGYSTSVNVESEICIAETVIVGNVPSTYFNLGDSGSADNGETGKIDNSTGSSAED